MLVREELKQEENNRVVLSKFALKDEKIKKKEEKD